MEYSAEEWKEAIEQEWEMEDEHHQDQESPRYPQRQ